jgi:accessory colonization factor AcfC
MVRILFPLFFISFTFPSISDTESNITIFAKNSPVNFALYQAKTLTVIYIYWYNYYNTYTAVRVNNEVVYGH